MWRRRQQLARVQCLSSCESHRHHEMTTADCCANDPPGSATVGPNCAVSPSRGASQTSATSPTSPGVAEATLTLPAPNVPSTLNFNGVRSVAGCGVGASLGAGAQSGQVSGQVVRARQCRGSRQESGDWSLSPCTVVNEASYVSAEQCRVTSLHPDRILAQCDPYHVLPAAPACCSHHPLVTIGLLTEPGQLCRSLRCWARSCCLPGTESSPGQSHVMLEHLEVSF